MNITYKPNVNGYLPKPPPVLMTPWLILALFSHPAMDAQAAVERPSVATLQAQVGDLQTRVSRLEEQLTNVLKVVQQDGGGSRSAAAPVRASSLSRSRPAFLNPRYSWAAVSR